MFTQSLIQLFNRYRTLQTDRISALPIVILMPHSACNCKCVMCDIWKDNKNLKQLGPDDISGLLDSLKKFGTSQVVMSGGEALLNPNFFRLCSLLRQEKIKITLLSTGLLLKKNAEQLVATVHDIIVSVDGNAEIHDRVRNLPGAFQKMKEGISSIRKIRKDFPISGRTVIQSLNFRYWMDIIESAKEIGLNQISFLPADVSSHAFNREQGWAPDRQQEILLSKEDLIELQKIIQQLGEKFGPLFDNRFIAESPEKIQKIHDYYAAFYGLNPFPYKKCNAPWVSTVVEADGTVRPCFFHEGFGNIHQDSLATILNSDRAVHFRKSLDMDRNPVCRKCVCYLNLSPRARVADEP